MLDDGVMDQKNTFGLPGFHYLEDGLPGIGYVVIGFHPHVFVRHFHGQFIRGISPFRGLTITMVINHLHPLGAHPPSTIPFGTIRWDH